MNSKYFYIIFAAIFAKATATSHTSSNQNSILWINTTYQAEDLGIHYAKLSQCKAWNLWWKLQRGDIVVTNEIIDFLLTRRKQVSLNRIVHLKKFGLPKYLLSKYKIVHINFENVCKNYSRYLRIDSLGAAKQYGINLFEICNNHEAKKKAFLNMEDDRFENDKNYESNFST
ncbi:unnamed protein product, partial [Onchocerca ochengi]